MKLRTVIVSAALCLLLAGIVMPVVADWSRVEIGGVSVCKDKATGATFKPPYSSRSDVTKSCNTLTSFLPWLGTADAASLGFTLSPNPDGSNSTQFPCVLSDRSDCKPPTGASLAWTQSCLNTALAPITSQLTSTTTSINVESCLTGTNSAVATISFVQAADGTTSCAAQWSVTGSTPNRTLSDASPSAGSGNCKLKATYLSTTVLSTTQAWAYVAAGGSDTTGPNEVTGINGSCATTTCTLTFDPTDDPNDGVTRTGVATYVIDRDSVQIDTLAAASPGLTNDFTGTAIGVTTGSATQDAAGLTGGRWTVVNNGGTGGGLEGSQNDSVYAASTAVSGASLCVRANIFTITSSATYAKAALFAKNSTSATAAGIYAVVLKQSNGANYLQYMLRTNDGGTQQAAGQISLASLGGLRMELCVVSGVATIYYSNDGGPWTTAFANIAIPISDAKQMGCAAAATNDGASGQSITVVFNNCTITAGGQLTKTVAASSSGRYTVTAKDVANNSSAIVTGSITLAPAVSTATAKKWHPGYFLTTHRNNATLDSQALRFVDYDNNGNNSHLQGMHWLAKWSAFESSQGNYTAGITLIRNEIAHMKAETHPLRLVLQIMDEPNQSQCGSFACQAAFFPSYVASACLVTSTFNGYSATHFTWWRPACAQYYANLLTALGAALDSEPYLEAIILDYEQALEQDVVHGTDFSIGAFNAGVTTVVQAAAAAFPHTNVVWRANWGVDYTNDAITTLISIMKTNGVGWGDQDGCDLNPVTGAYTYGGALPSYISADNMFAGYKMIGNTWTAGQAVDQRGKMMSFFGIETSSMGDNAVCGSPGLTGLKLNNTYGAYYEWVDQAMQATHAIIDYNDYTGIAEQKWAAASSGKSFYDMVQTSPLTHTACPTDYDTKFGTGVAGSGCNTN